MIIGGHMLRLISALTFCFSLSAFAQNFDAASAMANPNKNLSLKGIPAKLVTVSGKTNDYQIDTDASDNLVWKKDGGDLYYARTGKDLETGRTFIGEAFLRKSTTSRPNQIDEVQIVETEDTSGIAHIKEVVSCKNGQWKNYAFERANNVGDCI